MFLPEHATGHDEVRVHSPEWDSQLRRNPRFGPFGATQRIFVTDHETRMNFGAKAQKIIVGIGAQNEPDIPLPKQLCQSSLHELVMTQIRVMSGRQQLKKHQHRLSELIPRCDGDIQRIIISGALRPLHPINHAASFGIGRAGSPG